MTYRNKYTGEEYEDYDDCRSDLITMQESGKGILLNVMHNYIAGLIVSTPENDAVLRAGLDFIKNCIRFSEEHLEGSVMTPEEEFVGAYMEEEE